MNHNNNEDMAVNNGAAGGLNPEDVRYWQRECRTHLHLAITAWVAGGRKALKALQRPPLARYCRMLSRCPDGLLGNELGRPVSALLDELQEVARSCQGRLARAGATESQRAADKRVLHELDEVLAGILGGATSLALWRAAETDSPELLAEVLGAEVPEGATLADWMRRCQRMMAAPGQNPDEPVPGGVPDRWARGVYERVEALDRLADEMPGPLRGVARQLPAWPTLGYRHEEGRRRVDELAERLDLGAETAIDAGAGARFAPGSPVVRYLIRLVRKLEFLRAELGDGVYAELAKEQAMLRMVWMELPEPEPGEMAVELLRVARQLPELRRGTAAAWAEQVIGPLILVTDARDHWHCAEPWLRSLAEGVKTGEEFAGRLLREVTKTLGNIARP